jgi:hypothetical protein
MGVFIKRDVWGVFIKRYTRMGGIYSGPRPSLCVRAGQR